MWKSGIASVPAFKNVLLYHFLLLQSHCLGLGSEGLSLSQKEWIIMEVDQVYVDTEHGSPQQVLLHDQVW